MERPSGTVWEQKRGVHRGFARCVKIGAFEALLIALGSIVKERKGFKLYECYIDGAFSEAKGGSDGVGRTKAGKGVKIMIMVDANGLPIAVNTGSASPHESTLVEPLFDFMISVDFPEKLIGDKAYDSDRLDEALAAKGVEMISPHRANRKPENKTQEGVVENGTQSPHFFFSYCKSGFYFACVAHSKRID